MQGERPSRNATPSAATPPTDVTSAATARLQIDPFSDSLAWGSVIISTILIFILVLGLRINQNLVSKWLPGLSGVCMVLGSVSAAIFSIIPADYRRGWTREDLDFHPDLFFYLLLPPIIFEAGFSLDRRLMRRNLGEIVLFAVGGTWLSAFVISKGMFFYFTNFYPSALSGEQGAAASGSLKSESDEPASSLQQGAGGLSLWRNAAPTTPTFIQRPHIVCDLFGALISATDPVATIALLNRFQNKFPARLRSVIFGEAILNDAVAIVLFDSVVARYDSSVRPLVGVVGKGTSERSVGEVVGDGGTVVGGVHDSNGGQGHKNGSGEGDTALEDKDRYHVGSTTPEAVLQPSGVYHDPAVEPHYYYCNLLLEFVYVSSLSLAIGLAASYALNLFFAKFRVSHFPPYELGLMLLFSYLAYAVAQNLDLSGIVALFICGVVFGDVLSHESKRAAEIFLSITALISECLVFFYLGVVAVLYVAELPRVSLLLYSFVLIFAARAAQVGLLSFALNTTHRFANLLKASGCLRMFGRLREANSLADFCALVRGLLVGDDITQSGDGTCPDGRSRSFLVDEGEMLRSPDSADFVHPYGFRSDRESVRSGENVNPISAGADYETPRAAGPSRTTSNKGGSRRTPFTWRGQALIVVAGLRGAISFALSLRIPDAAARKELVPCTIFLVVVTTLGVGSVMEHVAGLLGFLDPNNTVDEQEESELHGRGRIDGLSTAADVGVTSSRASYREMERGSDSRRGGRFLPSGRSLAKHVEGGSRYYVEYNKAALQAPGFYGSEGGNIQYEVPGGGVNGDSNTSSMIARQPPE